MKTKTMLRVMIIFAFLFIFPGVAKANITWDNMYLQATSTEEIVYSDGTEENNIIFDVTQTTSPLMVDVASIELLGGNIASATRVSTYSSSYTLPPTDSSLVRASNYIQADFISEGTELLFSYDWFYDLNIIPMDADMEYAASLAYTTAEIKNTTTGTLLFEGDLYMGTLTAFDEADIYINDSGTSQIYTFPVSVGDIISTSFYTQITAEAHSGSSVFGETSVGINMDVTNVPSVVPEPISSTLFIVGVFVLGMRRKFKKK